MNSEVAWVLLSSGTQVHPERILDPDFLQDYLSVSYDYDEVRSKIHGKYSENIY